MTNRKRISIINTEDNVAIIKGFIDRNKYIPSIKKTSSLLGRSEKYSANILNAVHFCPAEESSIFTPNFIVIYRSVLRNRTKKDEFNEICSSCEVCTNRYLSKQFKINEGKNVSL